MQREEFLEAHNENISSRCAVGKKCGGSQSRCKPVHQVLRKQVVTLHVSIVAAPKSDAKVSLIAVTGSAEIDLAICTNI